VFVLETGANDALRGQDPAATRANIEAILEAVEARAPQAKVLVLGMRAPPNLGARYATAFEAIYPEVARTHRAALVPFVLEGVAGIASLNQPDGVHPTPEGQRIMAETVWRSLRPLL
jgi:acyl-CoA thioesterase-1